MSPLRRTLPVVSVLAVLALAGCSEAPAEDDAPPQEAGWSYTDSRGETIELEAAPERVVALSSIALSLDTYGVELAGQLAYGGLAEEYEDTALADLPLVGDPEVSIEELAAMDPDVIVTLDWDGGVLDSLSGIEDKAAEIAPILTISAAAPLDEQLKSIADLAVALDSETTETVTEAAAGFAAAQESFRQIVTDRDDISVAALQTNIVIESDPAAADGARIFYPDQVGSLGLLQKLGLNLIVPSGEGQWAQNLSPELVNSYPSDVIIQKVDAWSTGGNDVRLELWNRNPAVAANQIYLWDASWDVLTYENWTEVLERLGAFIDEAKDVVED